MGRRKGIDDRNCCQLGRRAALRRWFCPQAPSIEHTWRHESCRRHDPQRHANRDVDQQHPAPPKALVITPPSIGPSAPAEPDVALQIESARASCSPVWVIVSRLRLLGTKAAAPTPWAQTAQLAANADGTLPSWSELTGRVDLNHASGVGTYTTTVVLPAS
jgi:hypothetical protein